MEPVAMSTDILVEEDLCPIACAWHKRGLIKWLENNRIPYVLAASGWPRVHRKALERAMGVLDTVEIGGKPVEFNFDSLK